MIFVGVQNSRRPSLRLLLRIRRICLGYDAAARRCPRAAAGRAGDRFGDRATTLAFADAVAVPVDGPRVSSAGGHSRERADRRPYPECHVPADRFPADATAPADRAPADANSGPHAPANCGPHAAANCPTDAAADPDGQPAHGHSQCDAGGRGSAVARHGKRLILLGWGRNSDRELSIQLG